MTVTLKTASAFLHIACRLRRKPLLKVSFSLRPETKKETKLSSMISGDLTAQEDIADKVAILTSSFPAHLRGEHESALNMINKNTNDQTRDGELAKKNNKPVNSDG